VGREILRRPVGVNEGECRGSEEYVYDLVRYARSEEMSERRDGRRGSNKYQVRYIIDWKRAAHTFRAADVRFILPPVSHGLARTSSRLTASSILPSHHSNSHHATLKRR
jgi:hypothetical protein